MKRKWLGLALCAVLACGATAMAEIFATDCAANYGEENPFGNDADGGYGFAPWECPDAVQVLAPSAEGLAGDIDSEENGFSFRIARDADNAWGHAYRNFNPLNPGDALSLRFTCVWDGGGRGIDLYADDGSQIANAVNLSPENNLSVNGATVSEDYAMHAVYKLALIQDVDGIDLVLARSVDGGDPVELTNTKISTSKKLGRIGFYAGGWDWNDGKNVENYALFVNDLEIVGEVPTDYLSLTPPNDDAWQVLSAEEELLFTVSRTGTDGELEVVLASNNPDFVSVPESVTIADGETDATFTATVTLLGYGNDAQITAEAVGVYGDNYDLHGPKYRISAVEQVKPGTTTNFWVDWDNNYMRDDSKLSLAIEPEGADFTADAPADWTWNEEEGGAYVEASYTANESARLVLKFDGVEMWGANVTVVEPTISIEGPTTLRPGQSAEYVVKTFTLEGGTTIHMTSSDDSLVSIDPLDYLEVAIPEDEKTFTVTSLGDEGNVTLTVTDDVDFTATLDIAIEAAPTYDDYVAYDDGSLYGANFDYAAVGEGTEKFLAWTEVFNNNDPESEFYAGATLVSSAADASVLTDGKALALYSNGGTEENKAEIKIRRPFVNSLSEGQAFGVQISPNYRDGAKGIVLQGEWEGNWYDRVEFYYGGESYAYKINGGDPVDLGWGYGTKLIEMSLYCEADGSGYTLAFSREGEEDVVVEDLTFDGTVDGALFYSWNGGQGDENNFVFNRMAIEQLAEPVEYREIGIGGTWNPDATGDYEFFVGPSEEGAPIGTVALTVEPADGRITIEPASVDVPGDDVAFFTVSVNSLPEEEEEPTTYTITATPADETVLPAVYYVTPARPYFYLYSESWEHTTDEGSIWLCLKASPSYYGTYNITTDNGDVLTVPEASTPVTVDEGQVEAWFDVDIVSDGEASIWATLDTNPEVYTDFHFKVTPGVEPVGGVIPVTAMAVDGGDLKLTLASEGHQVYGATEVNEAGGWVWQELDVLIEGTSVTLPMDEPKMIFKVE